MQYIKVDHTGSVATLTLDHGAKRNALSSQLVGEILEALDNLRAKEVRVVVIRAAPGAKVWSAGHDVGELPEGRRDPLGWDDPLRHVVRALETQPYPIVAMVEGSVWGGACEFVLACDIVIAAPEAAFAATPAKLGVPYNVSGMLTFLNAAPARVVREMLFTAQPISAVRACDLGIINHVVPADEIEAFTYELADQIAKNAPLSISVMKEQLRILAGAHPMSPQGFERVQGLRRQVYDSEDYREGIRAFKEKRPPRFEGH